MALSIVRAEEQLEVNHLVVVLYSAPGLGKTSLGFTAKNPILLDFDAGAYRSGNRRDTVRIRSWEEDVLPVSAVDLAPFDTVVVDTAGRALEYLADHVMARNKSYRQKDGSLSIRGYGALKTEFVGWLNWLRRLDLDVVLLAHVQETGSGETVKERIDVTGGSKNEIYKVADLMGSIKIDGGRRVIEFDPTEATFGKNPGNLPATVFPVPARSPDLLARLIAETKIAINEMTAEQKAEHDRLMDLRNEFAKLDTPEAFDGAAKKLVDEEARHIDKALLMEAARKRGFEFDRDLEVFVEPKKQDG